MSRFSGKSVLLTGAANGIGAAALARLAAEGAAVLAMDRDRDALERTCQRLESRSIEAMAGDVTAAADMGAAVARCVKRFGGLDAAILNAGIAGVSAPIHDYPLDVFDAVIRVNVLGVLHGIQAAVPALAARGGGAIVLTSSINGIRGFATFGAYAASKQAVQGLTRTAALDLAARNIRVNAVHPGVTDTRMMGAVETMLAPGDEARARKDFSGFAALKRYATSEEIAAALLFLASADASYITGASLIVDGGFTAGVLG